MAKVTYKGIKFDSELEVNYYKKLVDENVEHYYHHDNPIELPFMQRGYTIDFIELYHEEKIIKLVETKGYNQFSARMDTIIHNSMKKLVKTEDGLEFLRRWLISNGINYPDYEIQYQKIKFLKKHGFVDFHFKPRGLKDQWKDKAIKFEGELKLANKRLKEFERWISYTKKDKLTKPQKEWKSDFEFREGIDLENILL